MSYLLQPTILLLKDGTDTSQGKAQIVSNINAVQSIVEIVKTTLGPRGMDKLIEGGMKGATISNDGATILNLLDIVHPAAKTLVDIAKAQDDEVGDGTTSVCLLAGELLKESKYFIEEGMHPQIITKGYKEALKLALQFLHENAHSVADKNETEKREMLIKCAQTSLNSKLLAHYKEFFSELVVQAVETLETNLLDKDLIGIKMVTGGSVTDSFLVSGVAFKKTFSYAGFEQQPKKFNNPKICLLNIELELKAEKENAEIRIENPDDYKSIVDAEWELIYEKLRKIVESGANIVLSKLPIGDLATQYFADRNIFCAGRVDAEDMKRVQKSTGAIVQTTVNGLTEDVLGTCNQFEEVQIGAERYNLFKDCPHSKSATIILRGGAEQFIAEAERSLNDAIMIVRRCMKANKIVPGGGAIELEISRLLRLHSRKTEGKIQLVINAFAKALEVIPRTIADNAGHDSIQVLNKLRQKHAIETEQSRNFGVDINAADGIGNNYENFVWEPIVVRKNALSAATEAACTILSIDETVRNPKSEQPKAPPGGLRRGGPQGMAGLAKNAKLGK
ncbi:TCP-1 (CTT or eukaryotic type II) chaperonin family, eta subunit (macronuclear) [Tetrahymena thermophila SB210]|nr:TCP-1 (CTT or eukaryotic type II) chaperonin family, eta subunit [Tetrahymena thermophila SB210]EAS07742.2 TCP-1 (CTT or eukaryotic type II) chaperonin family, eta subunit [Tetrahymena thermophila SB210]|eukprot:XP_001027984.2 TCP-1 (CTT or eukaryotic type II) chaperonin family, eta subunit [Tetrahymena thermophila SB210]